ncbi:hypothetical protein C0J50_0419 [Silurus asotus]|uniref:Uncharacterized protein n=1 Tax=Silurus asotus TaxID=30991 RepID=A0AAD5AFW3_SILAS|nr:hypothetical protein C0J50_0419 [Silurus asotus]
MKLFTSPDYSVQLDSSTKVPTNKRLYAQVWSLLHGNVDLNIKVTSCYVHSKGLQPLERSVSLKQEPCLACYNNTRFSFLLDTLQDLPTNNWELRCNVTHCMKSTAVVSCAQPELVTENVQVVPSLVPSTPNQCVDFSLQSVLGIAFGGFLIGVLLIGALWFIKIRTDVADQPLLYIRPDRDLKPSYTVTSYTVTRYTVTRYTVTRYTVTRYSVTRYTVTRYSVTRYTVTRYSVTRYTVTRYIVTR